MNQSSIILTLLFTFIFAPTKASMKVALDGDFLSIESTIDDDHHIKYEFCYCMANDLYTFSRVLIDSTVVNEATSDNIGPFLIEGHGWTGGNHLLPDGETRSAHTDKVRIVANGRNHLKGNFHGTAARIDIFVTNTLLDPSNPRKRFCTENVHYLICGNSIQVAVCHKYHNLQPLTIARYYGMQSMMIGETSVLTPHGAYSSWTPIEKVGRFTRQSAPDFHQFIEHSPVCYAAAYMTDKGIGDRHLVMPDDVVFIGNSWSKSYHKLIGNASVKSGDKTCWEGIYTWFLHPEQDCDSTFSYRGYYNGKRAVFSSSPISKDKILTLK